MSTTNRAPDDALPPAHMVAGGLQHVLVMYAGTAAVPLVIGAALKLPKEQIAFLVNAQLFACGVATLIQCLGFWRFGIRLPLTMGASVAVVGPAAALAASGVAITGLIGAVIAGGVFAVAVAPFASRLVRYFPPVVTGTVIAVAGVSLLRVAIGWAVGGGARDFGDPANLAIVALVLAAILVTCRLFNRSVANLAVLVGMIVGLAAALGVGRIELAAVRDAEWVGLIYPLRFGAPSFEPGAIASLCVVMIVVMVESTAMFLALGEICGRTTGPSDLGRGLAANGVVAILAGALACFPSAPSAQNVGLVAITGSRSRWSGAVAGAFLIALGLLPKFGALVAAIPQPVVGGAALLLFGMVAAVGIRVLARVDYARSHNLIVIAVGIAVGLVPMIAPTFFALAPKWISPLVSSGVTLAAISTVVLNRIFDGAYRAAARQLLDPENAGR